MSEAVSRSRTDHRVSSLRQKGLGGGGLYFWGARLMWRPSGRSLFSFTLSPVTHC